LSILTAVAAAGALAGCAAKAQTAPVEPIAIAVEAARPSASLPLYAGPGTVAATHTYRLAFDVAGRVATVNVDVGDRVGAGQVLAAIDASDYGEQLRAARARADAASAAAAKAERGSRPEELAAAGQSVAAAQAQVQRAQAAEELAAANLRRSRALFGDGDIAAQSYDAAVTAERDASGALAAARAALSGAQAQAALVAQGPRDEDRRAAAADAEAAQASADLAATTLGKTALRAPADALVLSRAVEPGSEAQPGQVVFVLVDASDPDVIVPVPAARAAEARGAATARVTVAGRTYAAQVERVEPAADPATRTAIVRLRVRGLRAAPGDVANVLLGTRNAGGTSVPLGALIQRNGIRTVDVYDEARGTVAERAVGVVAADGDRAIVRGIAPGERIVVAGQYQVHAGDRVRVVPLEGSAS